MILHLTTVHPRRDVRIWYKECLALHERGRRVGLAVMDGFGHTNGDGDPPVMDLGKPPLGRIPRAVLGFCRSSALLLRLRPTVLHFHDPELIATGLVAKMVGIPAVYDVHEDLPRQLMEKRWIPKRIRRLLGLLVAGTEKAAGAAFDGMVAATPGIARRFPEKKTVTVFNYPEAERFATGGDRPYHSRENRFVYVGPLTTGRGVSEMIQAIGMVDPRLDGFLDLAGDFRPAGLAGRLSHRSGWARVRHRGWVPYESVPTLLSTARAGMVVLHPIRNYREAYPVKLFEYMAAGLPVVASDFPIWRGIVEGAGCGLLVDPLDPTAIARAMEWILAHPEEAHRMGIRGRDAVLRQYHWSGEAVKLERLYEAVDPQESG